MRLGCGSEFRNPAGARYAGADETPVDCRIAGLRGRRAARMAQRQTVPRARIPTPAFARAVSVAWPPILPTPTDRPFLLQVAETAIVFTLVASRHLVQVLIVAGHERVW